MREYTQVLYHKAWQIVCTQNYLLFLFYSVVMLSIAGHGVRPPRRGFHSQSCLL